MFDISKLFHLAWFQRIHSMISQVLAKIKDEQHEERMEKHIDVECKSEKPLRNQLRTFHIVIQVRIQEKKSGLNVPLTLLSYSIFIPTTESLDFTLLPMIYPFVLLPILSCLGQICHTVHFECAVIIQFQLCFTMWMRLSVSLICSSH